MKKAVFLDRDGVINIDNGYVYKIEEFCFYDDIFELLKQFQKSEYLLIIITNQAGIAREYYSEDDFFKLTEWMLNKFNEHEIKISEVYFCPHHPDFTGKCSCRKPNNGMILKAKDKYNIDLKSSILIGDKESDIEAGISSGISDTILVNKDVYFTKAKFQVKNIKRVGDILHDIGKI